MSEEDQSKTRPDARRDAALAYARREWAVYPCEGKQPHTRLTIHGDRDATTDPGQIDRWWRADPTANVGMSLRGSGLVVLDVDVHEATGTKPATDGRPLLAQRDVAGCAVLGDVGQAGHVAAQQFLAERSVQHRGDLVRLHAYSSRCRSRSIPQIVLVGRRSAATGR